jgi:hypothetical protein
METSRYVIFSCRFVGEYTDGFTHPKEAGTRIIQFDDREPLLVEKMLECLYKGDYKYETLVAVLSYKRPFHASENTDAASIPETPSTDYQTTPSEACLTPGSSTEPESDVRPRTAWSSPARFHASMYAYANYFGIELLKARAKQHFNQTFLDQYFSSQFEDTIHEVYAPTPEHDRGLRDIVVNMTMMSLQTLRTLPRRILDDETLKHCPKFTLDLCIALADSRTKPLLAHNSPVSDDNGTSESDTCEPGDDSEVADESEVEADELDYF